MNSREKRKDKPVEQIGIGPWYFVSTKEQKVALLNWLLK